MRIIGLAVVFLASCFFVSDYTANIKARLDEYKGTFLLLSYIRSSFMKELKPLSEILREFESSEDFDKMPQLSFLNNKENKSEIKKSAFDSENIRDKLSCFSSRLDRDDENELGEFFSSFGNGCVEEENRRLNGIIRHFEEKCKNLSSKAQKDIKVAWLIFSTAFLGIFILVL